MGLIYETLIRPIRSMLQGAGKPGPYRTHAIPFDSCFVGVIR
jgi:hypothetical protein